MISIIFAKWALSNSCLGVNPEDMSSHLVLVKPKVPKALAKSMVVARQLLGILPLVESFAAAFEATAIPEKVFFLGPSSVSWKYSWFPWKSWIQISGKHRERSKVMYKIPVMVPYLVIFYSNYLVLRNEKLVIKCENSWTRSMYSYLFIASCRHFVACVLTMLTSLIRVMKVGTFFMPFVPTSISLLWYCCGSTAALSVHSTKIRYTTIVRRDIYSRYYYVGVVPKYSLLARPLLLTSMRVNMAPTRLDWDFRCDLTFEICLT